MKKGDVITLNTKGKSWRHITIQAYHGLKAEIVNLSKDTDLMTVKILNGTAFKKLHPSLSASFVYMPKWAADKTKYLMEIE